MIRPLRHPAGDFGRVVSCGVEGHPPVLDSDGECAACIAVEEEADAAIDARRRAAKQRREADVRDCTDGILMLRMARAITRGDLLGTIENLGCFAERQIRRPVLDSCGYEMIAAACWDRLADEDERERAERAAEDAADARCVTPGCDGRRERCTRGAGGIAVDTHCRGCWQAALEHHLEDR